LAKIFLTQLAIKSLLTFSPHLKSASALPGETEPNEMNEKTSIDLWAPTASLLQSLIVMQQCIHQM